MFCGHSHEAEFFQSNVYLLTLTSKSSFTLFFLSQLVSNPSNWISSIQIHPANSGNSFLYLEFITSHHLHTYYFVLKFHLISLSLLRDSLSLYSLSSAQQPVREEDVSLSCSNCHVVSQSTLNKTCKVPPDHPLVSSPLWLQHHLTLLPWLAVLWPHQLTR